MIRHLTADHHRKHANIVVGFRELHREFNREFHRTFGAVGEVLDLAVVAVDEAVEMVRHAGLEPAELSAVIAGLRELFWHATTFARTLTGVYRHLDGIGHDHGDDPAAVVVVIAGRLGEGHRRACCRRPGTRRRAQPCQPAPPHGRPIMSTPPPGTLGSDRGSRSPSPSTPSTTPSGSCTFASDISVLLPIVDSRTPSDGRQRASGQHERSTPPYGSRTTTPDHSSPIAEPVVRTVQYLPHQCTGVPAVAQDDTMFVSPAAVTRCLGHGNRTAC